MLETIAEYALECLEERGELEELRRRHGEYYLKRARSVERLIRSPQAAKLLDRLEPISATCKPRSPGPRTVIPTARCGWRSGVSRRDFTAPAISL